MQPAKTRRTADSVLMSLNVLAHPDISKRSDDRQLHPESPTAIKQNLELARLDKELFPSLTTGVRWWPFLCLAFDCATKAELKRVFVATRRLKRDLGTNARIGPSTSASFRPYRSMASHIRDDPRCAKLYRHLQGLSFRGSKSFFVNFEHEKKWQKFFLAANGKPAKAYYRAHRDASRKGHDPTVLDIVTMILRRRPSQYDPLLWRGCFSFALLRCLYGVFDRQKGEAASYGDYVLPWKESLLKILKNPPPSLPPGALNPAYKRWLEKIESEDPRPPLAAQTKLFRTEDRPVLAALRIPLFHTLYFDPHPSRMGD